MKIKPRWFKVEYTTPGRRINLLVQNTDVKLVKLIHDDSDDTIQLNLHIHEEKINIGWIKKDTEFGKSVIELYETICSEMTK